MEEKSLRFPAVVVPAAQVPEHVRSTTPSVVVAWAAHLDGKLQQVLASNAKWLMVEKVSLAAGAHISPNCCPTNPLVAINLAALRELAPNHQCARALIGDISLLQGRLSCDTPGLGD